jgi:pyrophosphatase PpaX
MTSIDTVLFDLDGTLIDSIDLILKSYRHTMRVHRSVEVPDAVWLEGLGTPLRDQLRAVSDDPAEIERMVDTYREFNFAHHDAMVRPFPGIHEAVCALDAAGFRLGIVTSKARVGLARGLEVCGLDGLFTGLVSIDEVSRYKPHPEPVFKALEILAARPAHTVFVGDSPHDMAAGRDAGVHTAAAMWGPFPREVLEQHSPDYWLESPQEITALLSI